MTLHLLRDLDLLRKRLLDLGTMVEQAIGVATDAFVQRDAERAREVIHRDRDVDRAEVRLEEECLKMLALHQPVAGDLRFVIAALKVNADLERMGDAAESIAARALQIQAEPTFAVPREFHEMVAMARGMTRKALECLVQGDPMLAREVLRDDSSVDAAQRRMFEVLQEAMREDPVQVGAAVLTLSATRQIERIADLATNIAEDVVFMHEGEIIRHKRTLRLS